MAKTIAQALREDWRDALEKRPVDLSLEAVNKWRAQMGLPPLTKPVQL